MILPDVNILIYAHRTESPRHDSYREWLSTAATASETLGLCDPVVTGFLRIVTNSRIYRDPTPPDVALSFCRALLDHPGVERISAGAQCWRIFDELMSSTRSRGNDVPDAWLAAMAIERSATWVSEDADFGRYERLRWERPSLGEE